MKYPRSKIVPVIAGVLILGGFCAARLLNINLFERLELVSYDIRVRAAQDAASPCATNLGFVFIDEETISAVKNRLLGAPYGLYWPRHVYGLIVEEADAEGAKSIAFDVLFGELRPDLGGIIRNGKSIESDEFLALQMQDHGNVLLASEENLMPPALFATNALALGDIRTDKDTDGVLRRAVAFRDYRIWNPVLKAVEADPDFGVDLSKAEIEADRIILKRPGEEAIVVPLDSDGLLSMADFYGENLPPGVPEKAPPFTTKRVWHMGIVLAAQELGLDLDSAEVDLDKGEIRLRGADVERVLPVDRLGRFYIDWSIPINDSRLYQEPAVNLLRRNIAVRSGALESPPQDLAGRFVVVGSTATGNDLNDYGATPLDRNTFLVSKHWNVANSIIVNRFIHRGSTVQESLFIIVVGTIVGLLALGLRPLAASALTAAGLVGYVLLAFWLYASHRIWIPVVVPLIAAISLYLAITTWKVFFEQNERRRVRSVFSRVVSPNVVNELLGARELALGGARREITVFFADIRGFTALTDAAQQVVADIIDQRNLSSGQAKELYDQQAAETLNTVNLYLARVADVIKKHNGTLDKYIGDCVMAFWGAPTPNPQHATACVRAAIEAQRAIAQTNRERQQENQNQTDPAKHLPLLALGSGINTGEATVGLMGSDAHILSYTVFGREVNVASRLEGVSGRDRIVISEATFKHLQRDDPGLASTCIPLEAVSVKGIREPVRIYEVPWH